MMLHSLSITNYRNLKDLQLNSLGRVNLITGKNNTGKSTLLEAIAIYARRGDLGLLGQLIEEHGENINIEKGNINLTEVNLKLLSSLFYNRNIGFLIEDAILIDNLSIRFVQYADEVQKNETGDIIRRRVFSYKDSERDNIDYKAGLEVKYDTTSFIKSLSENLPFYSIASKIKPVDNLQFVRTRNIGNVINSNLFDAIALTDKEQYVIDALKIIEPQTERIAFIDDGSSERKAVIKLSNSQQILPLQSMGDGINRILTIILAMVNCENGFLLIDEFENGLHYSVQEKLWEIVFKLSQELNIQVFATTHSNDCINRFGRVLNNQNNTSDGKLIRLDNDNGVIKQVEFDARELKIANKQNIEIR